MPLGRLKIGKGNRSGIHKNVTPLPLLSFSVEPDIKRSYVSLPATELLLNTGHINKISWIRRVIPPLWQKQNLPSDDAALRAAVGEVFPYGFKGISDTQAQCHLIPQRRFRA